MLLPVFTTLSWNVKITLKWSDNIQHLVAIIIPYIENDGLRFIYFYIYFCIVSDGCFYSHNFLEYVYHHHMISVRVKQRYMMHEEGLTFKRREN